MLQYLKTYFFLVIFPILIGLKAECPAETPLPCLNKKFTIVAHIVNDSAGNANITEATILSSIDYANTFFKNICVSFEICEFRYIENYQYDSLKWAQERPEVAIKNNIRSRINMVFIAGMVDEDAVCGKASVGGIAGFGDVYILKKCTGAGDFTILHELGHYFGLVHTFEGSGNELADGSNCTTAGDAICDTPADPFVFGDSLSLYVKDCRFISSKRDANGQYYDADVTNIMSYYDCICDFTDGQYRKMAETYLSSSTKNW